MQLCDVVSLHDLHSVIAFASSTLNTFPLGDVIFLRDFLAIASSAGATLVALILTLALSFT